MKIFYLFVLMGGLVFTNFVSGQAADLSLANNGASDYSIVLPVDCSAVQETAAHELQTYFKQVTDVELPIVSESELPTFDENFASSQKVIVLGPGKLSQQLLGDDRESKIGYDGIILKTVGNTIVLSGSPKRGTLYAVYELLEKYLSCRWWTSTESTIPHLNNVIVPDNLDVHYTPKLTYRESYYRDIFNPMFAVKLRCNGAFEGIPQEYGSHHSFQYFVHSSFALIPPQKYFLDHPDWFAEIDGIRKFGYPNWAGPSAEIKELQEKLSPEQIYSSGAQLCFSNDEMIAEMIKNAREALHNNPDATFLSISQNDWQGYCTCEKCRAIDEEEGSHSGSLLRAVNKVAEALEEEFPNLYVETLAYQYTRKPPKITKPRKNVIVRLCSIECSFAHPLDSETNKTFRDDLVGWSQVADNLFVWDYATDFAFYLLPFPNYRVVAPNINFYIDHNVVGFFEQGDYQCQTGDFVQLRNWMVAKLLWDPSLKPEELADEFIAGYYAPELVPIYRQYFNLLSDAVEKSGCYLGIYKQNTAEWLDIETLYKATELQREALEIATKLENDSPDVYNGLVKKVRREQIPIDLVWANEYTRIRTEHSLLGVEFKGSQDPLQLAKDLCAKLDEYGVTLRKESESPDAFAKFKNDLVKGYEGYSYSEQIAPECCENLPKNSWFIFEEYDMATTDYGNLAFVEDDSVTSNGRAIRMPGSHYEWATSWKAPAYLKFLASSKTGEIPNDGRAYHIYAFVRCQASVDDGTALTIGVYDPEQKVNVLHRVVSVSEIKGDSYQMIDLGVAPMTAEQWLWFAPPKRPGEVENVFIDRILVVRE